MKVSLEVSKQKSAHASLRPDFISTSVADVDFKYLKSIGITACFIDLDGTVVSRGTFEVDQKIQDVLKNSGLAIHIATNRPKSRSLKSLKEQLHATSVIHPKGVYGKPTKKYYLAALKELGLKKSEVVMIGDRFIQDIYGANRAGIYSLAVFKLGAHKGRVDKTISGAERRLTDKLFASYNDSSVK